MTIAINISKGTVKYAGGLEQLLAWYASFESGANFYYHPCSRWPEKYDKIVEAYLVFDGEAIAKLPVIAFTEIIPAVPGFDQKGKPKDIKAGKYVVLSGPITLPGGTWPVRKFAGVIPIEPMF